MKARQQNFYSVTNKKSDPFQNNNPNSTLVGILFLLGGLLFFIKQAGYVTLPQWSLIWPSALILLGVFLAIKQKFTDSNWIILIVIGSVFLTHQLAPELNIKRFILPIILVTIGLSILLRRKNSDHSLQQFTNTHSTSATSAEDIMDLSFILSGVNKRILSDNFQGGRVFCLMGGSEIDLTQSTIQNTATISLEIIMGGVTLIVPSNWRIKSNVNVVLGGIEDDRGNIHSHENDQRPTLQLMGNVIMGGIEIRN